MAVLKFSWLLPVLVKFDANIFEVNMTNQEITKKQFSTTKDCTTTKANLCNTCIEKKYIMILLRKIMLFSHTLALLYKISDSY